MEVEIHPEAEQEFIEASRRYDLRVPGLGERFITELEQRKELLAQRPKLGAVIGSTFRHLAFRRFPYALIYAVEPTGCGCLLSLINAADRATGKSVITAKTAPQRTAGKAFSSTLSIRAQAAQAKCGQQATRALRSGR